MALLISLGIILWAGIGLLAYSLAVVAKRSDNLISASLKARSAEVQAS